MIIKPKVRGFMCVTTHPMGCDQNIKRQIDYVKSQNKISTNAKSVLIIGSSTGYGMASRISMAFGANASTIGVFFEKPGTSTKTGTAGWYNSAAFHKYAKDSNLYAKSINGDAFSDEIKNKVIELIKKDLGQIDLVIYSLASPRRKHPKSGEVFNSSLKPIGKKVIQNRVNTDKNLIEEVSIDPASDKEIKDTIAVMGGEDWQMWITDLAKAGVLANGIKTTAYTYIGDKVTWDIYWHGTIGQAKQDLDMRVKEIRSQLSSLNGDARVSVLKAVVTQASSAIPVMPLYLALLFKVMKGEGTHEGCIEQIFRLFKDKLYGSESSFDSEGRLRVDDKELAPHVQRKVEELWECINSENLDEKTDIKGYKKEFMNLFGFEVDGVDYNAEVDTEILIPSCID